MRTLPGGAFNYLMDLCRARKDYMEVVDKETMQYARLLRPAIQLFYEQGEQYTLKAYEAILKNAKPQNVKTVKKALHFLWNDGLLEVDPRPVFKEIKV